ncbi:MAG: MFS transporter [Verrucomicrobia bacterium]|nr:MFS transporter [Verrucomicrobiota bacterium]
MSENRRAIWSWAFIDWANSAFAIVVMTAFFPIFFKDHWCQGPGMTAEKSTFYLGLANTISSLVVAVVAPLLGSIADQGNGKRRFLLGFTLLGSTATALLPLAAQGQFTLAATLYAIAALGFSGNNMFSDALLTDVAEPARYDRVSALGYALGYVGSGGLFVFCSLLVKEPAKFGLSGPVPAVHLAFWLTAGWWLLFTLPALLWVREAPGVPPAGAGSVLTRGFRQLVITFRDLRRDRRILYFLGGYILYIDGVNTVIKMAVDFGKAIGLDSGGLLLALIVTQFVAFPAAIAFGRIGERFGARRGIMLGVAVYAGLCLFATRMDSQREFFAMAVVVGLVQGGVQSLSRSYFARLIPADKGGEYFGFYNMVGKFAAILGPTLMGVAALLTDSRTSILSLLLLFGGGLWLLSRVREDAPPTHS